MENVKSLNCACLPVFSVIIILLYVFMLVNDKM